MRRQDCQNKVDSFPLNMYVFSLAVLTSGGELEELGGHLDAETKKHLQTLDDIRLRYLFMSSAAM